MAFSRHSGAWAVVLKSVGNFSDEADDTSYSTRFLGCGVLQAV
jgi:hypothetical protein